LKKRKQALALEIEAGGAVSEDDVVGVLGREGLDLGLEIIELLSGGYSGVDSIDSICSALSSFIIGGRCFNTTHVEKPLAIWVWTIASN
jgi:hypothetical protein